MTAIVHPLRFQIGARTLASVPRRLHRVGLGLAEVLGRAMPALPPLAPGDAGWLVTSVPEDRVDVPAGYLTLVRQRYERHYLDLARGEAAWLAGLSGSARSGIKRKAKKVAEASGGTLDVRRYHDAAGFAAFHPLARAVSARTYQERLLGAGLPEDPTTLIARAGRDEVRAWLLFLADEPIAYLACTADGAVLRYDHVGHDPAHGALSPGAVLQVEALRELFGDRFAWFDFTEGEGQHKRQFASGSVACVDLLILRPTLANRVLAAALTGFDRAIAWGKQSPAVARLGARLRR
jgi:hypothetical protein